VKDARDDKSGFIHSRKCSNIVKNKGKKTTRFVQGTKLGIYRPRAVNIFEVYEPREKRAGATDVITQVIKKSRRWESKNLKSKKKTSEEKKKQE